MFNRDPEPLPGQQTAPVPAHAPAPALLQPQTSSAPTLQPQSLGSKFSSDDSGSLDAPKPSFTQDVLDESEWQMTQSEWDDYKMMFRNADTGGNSRLKGSQAAPCMMNYGVDKTQVTHSQLLKCLTFCLIESLLTPNDAAQANLGPDR